MGCGCGGAKATQNKFKVTTPKGTYEVGSTAEARIRIAKDGGGTYKAVAS